MQQPCLQRQVYRQVVQMRRCSRQEVFQTHRSIPFQRPSPPPQLILHPSLAPDLALFYEMPVDGSQLLTYAEAIRSADPLKMHSGVIGLRRLQSEDSRHPAQEFTVTSLIPLLVELLGLDEWPQLQLETARLLAHLTEAPHLAELIQESRGVERLLEVLDHEEKAIQLQAVCALGNIAQASARLRDEVIRRGGLVRIAALPCSKELQPECCWALAGLANGRPAPRFPLIKQALPIICAGVAADVFKGWVAQTECLQILARDCRVHPDRIEILVEGGLLRKLLENLESEHLSLVMVSLILLQHVAEGSLKQKDELVGVGTIPYLAKLLHYPKTAVRRQACGVMSSLADSSNPLHPAAILRWEGLLDTLVHLLSADACEVKAEVCYTLVGVIKSGEPEEMRKMIEDYGLLRNCMDMVVSELHETVEAAVECLEVILGVSQTFKEEWIHMGGVEVLERLQYHRSNEVYETVTRIMENNFIIEPL